ncbi:hypothetical protein N3K66_005298 [Trichothecium roseum]|uniref:Uncharacterized protein n=1 Tax=Trichothecium roseum TaxID=47278 RepID=A0ACC0UXG0_9HYPO|nr:hypothetical protein N3K66_005298 [Trichothecium roseum]
MAQPLPPSLKIPEVSRFVNRANQLRSIKPAIAYWCDYHAVNQIVAKSLHTADDSAYAYTKTLIERLETTKTELAAAGTDDGDGQSVTDNAAGRVAVEAFARQTFDRAERTLRADKVTRQTADTFDAAATFYDLLREWGELEPDVAQKIRFAKWNAARILKAIREGRDPNESNPKMDEDEDEAVDEGLEAELRDMTAAATAAGSSAAHPVTIEDAPETGESSSTAAAQPPPPPEEYFPQVPSASARDDAPPPPPSWPASAPGMPPEAPPSSGSQIPPQPSPHIPTKLPPQFAPPPPEPTIPTAAPPPPPAAVPSQPVVPAWTPPAPAPVPSQQAPPPPAAAAAASMHYKDLNQAQKHAKWAISALNFEDVPTAVQELRNALAVLGAQ